MSVLGKRKLEDTELEDASEVAPSAKKQKLNSDSTADNSPSISVSTSTVNAKESSPQISAKSDANKDSQSSLRKNESYTPQLIVKSIDDKLLQHFISYTSNQSNSKPTPLKDTEWTLDLFKLASDPTHESYSFIGNLFAAKLLDWKEFVTIEASNNFLSLIKDPYSIWRGAALLQIFQTRIDGKDHFLVKIPLAGVDLHFRRQKLGSLVMLNSVATVVSILNDFYNSSDNASSSSSLSSSFEVDFLPMVMNDEEAKKFWSQNGCQPIEQHNTLSKILTKEELLSNGFMTNDEKNLFPFIYKSDKSADVVQQSSIFKQFTKPKYVNFYQKYATEDQIELVKKMREKLKRETEKAKKERENNPNQAKKEDDDDDHTSDEDWAQDDEEEEAYEESEYEYVEEEEEKINEQQQES